MQLGWGVLVTVLLGITLVTAFPRGHRKRGHRARWGTLTADQVNGFRKSLNRTNLDRFHRALDRFRDRVNDDQDDQEINDFNQRIKNIPTKQRSKSWHKFGDSVAEVNDKVGISENLYKGDMALTDEQVDLLLGDFVDNDSDSADSQETLEKARKRRQAYKDSRYPANLWGSTVYYYFDPSLSAAAKTAAQLAIAFWQNSTCVNFVQSTTATNRIRIFRGSGCYSYVGMIGRVQDLSLGNGCESVGTAAHELGHALGFFHEQSRVDRDSAITVNLANIQSGWADQFSKETAATNFNYGLPYDYGSVMQYGGTSVSGNGKPTMVAKVTPYQDTMGSDIVSFYDISMMNEHYQCKKKCTSGATCLNGGFRNSRNCNSCVCPSGWSGATCNVRPSGCGGDLTATTSLKAVTINVGNGQATEKPTFATCIYHIKAPAGKKIELTLSSLQNQQCFDGCIYTGLEVKAISDHRYTGIRYCCSNDAGTKIVSQSNIMPLIAYNRYYKSTVTINYRYVEATVASTVTTAQIPNTKPTL